MDVSRRALIGTAPAFGAALATLPTAFRQAMAQGSGPLRIGALNSITGPGGVYGGAMQKAILMAADEVNAAGGVAGRRVEVFAEDDQTAPEAAVLAAKKLIEVNRVQAILGTWSSGVAAAVMPVTDGADVLHATNAGSANITSSKGLMFRYGAFSTQVGQALVSMIADRGETRLASMAFNNPSGREITAGARAGWEKLGRKLVAEVVYEPNRPSYRSEVQRILASRPDAVLIGGYLPDFTIILREARQAGSKVRFYVPAWAVNQKLIDALGPVATENVFMHDQVAALDGEAFRRFSAKFRKATGIDPVENYYACCAYDMMIVVALAAEASALKTPLAGSMRTVANPPGIRVYDLESGLQALRSGTEIDYQGASGSIDFDAQGNARPLFKLSQLRGGRIEPVGGVFEPS